MKRFVRYILIASLTVVLSAPVLEARNNNGNRGNSSHTTGTQAGRRPGTSGTSRPGNNGNNGNHNANNGNHNGNNNRPNIGNNGNHNGNHNGNNWGNHNPGHNPGYNNGFKPGGGHAPVYTPPPPAHKPHNYWPNYHRPTPPPGYVYTGRGPSFGSILGMVLGTAFNASLNYLYSNGYNVASYGDNTIYLNNVMQLNYNWPNAVLYYTGGMLSSSQYIYSSQWNDVSRYNMIYNTLCNQYGMPASVNTMGGLMSASWFGGGNRFVTIQYSQGYNANGLGCFYTTLTFGN